MEDQEVKYYQPKFKRLIQSKYWDSIAERIPDSFISLTEKVMAAEKDGDCSWIVWKNCDYVLDEIRKIADKVRKEQ